MRWPGWPGSSQADTLDFMADVTASGTGQAPTVFWSSFEAMKVWDVSLGSAHCDAGQGEGGRGMQPWRLRCERRRVKTGGDGDGEGLGLESELALTGKVPVLWMCCSAVSKSGTEMASAQSQSRRPSLTGSLRGPYESPGMSGWGRGASYWSSGL